MEGFELSWPIVGAGGRAWVDIHLPFKRESIGAIEFLDMAEFAEAHQAVQAELKTNEG